MTGTGLVSEYQLDYDGFYIDSKVKHGRMEPKPLMIEATRTYTYDDSDILAKDEEEKRLYQVWKIN